jgi:diguanylate cyclase (GGDEF)-like protein/PAS domain S-box-containing protein
MTRDDWTTRISLFLEQAFHRLRQKLFHHHRIVKGSEDLYRDLVESSQYLICTHDLNGQILSVNQEGARLLGYDQKNLFNKNIRDFLAPKVRDQFGTYLETIQQQGAAKGVILLQTAKGERRIWQYNNTLRTEGVTSPIVRAIAHDVTERIQAEKAVKRLSQEHAVMAEIGRIISSTLDIDKVYDRFGTAVRRLIHFDRISISIINPEDHTVTVAYAMGTDMVDRRPGDVFPLSQSVNENILQSRSSVFIQKEDIREIAEPFPFLLPSFRAGFRSMISVPLISKDQVIGALNLRSLKVNAYTGRDLEVAERIGIQISGVIANAQLFMERQQAGEALRAEKQRFQTLSESAPFGIILIDQAGTFKYINPKFREIFGYDLRDAPDGKTWFRKAFPDPAYKHQAISLWINELGRSKPGEKISETFTVACKDGTEKIVNFIPLKLETGEYFMCCVDITDRKHAEEALRQSEERFRELYYHAPVGYHEYDLEGRITNVNLTDLEMLGYTREEMVGHCIWEFNVGEERVRQEVLEKLQGLRPLGQNLERIYRRKDGTTFPVLIQDRLILNEQGKITGIRSILQDITDRKRAEEKLRESEERFRQLAENIREVFYVYEEGITQYVSPAYEEIWGRPSQSLYRDPTSFWDTVHPEDKDRVVKSLEKKSWEEVEEVYRIVRPDGSIRWIKERSFPIDDDSGKPHRIVGIATDITDLKLGEEELKYLGLHDPLTGLYNRIYFEEEMSRIEKSRYDRVGIISCDVDGLKLVNDTLGHTQGDNLLTAAARVIRESVREGDLVARIGGDEFSIILPNTTASAVENVCQRIQEAVANYNVTNSEFPLSISIGFALKNPTHRNLKDLFREADNNMYRKKLYRTQNIRSTILKSLIHTLNEKDPLVKTHVNRLEKLLASMATLIGLPESATSDLLLLAKFHDIGQVAISDSILFKKSPLTLEEWTEMKRHCEIGYRIALSASDLVPIADWILRHHEWWDGSGYPLCIRGEEIPIECRLFAIADAYEAMTSPRPYRRAFSHGEAVAELLNHSETQFDPKLLKKFLQTIEAHPLESDSDETSAA